MGIHCLVCGRAFEPIRSSRVTCSAKCRKKKSRNALIINRVKALQEQKRKEVRRVVSKM